MPSSIPPRTTPEFVAAWEALIASFQELADTETETGAVREKALRGKGLALKELRNVRRALEEKASGADLSELAQADPRKALVEVDARLTALQALRADLVRRIEEAF